MKRQLRSALIVFATIAISSIGSIASAQPVIDGYFSPGEWAAATNYQLKINLPEGGATAGDLYIWNDLTDIYVAVRYQRTTVDEGVQAGIIFDWQRTGILSDGNDSIALQQFPACGQPSFYDGFITSASPACAFDGVGCNTEDTLNNGSQDGRGTIRRDGVWMTYEMRHPLNSGDFRDMAVTRPMTMEFGFQVSLSNTAGIGVFTVLQAKYRMY